MARHLLVGAALLAALTETLAQPDMANFFCLQMPGARLNTYEPARFWCGTVHRGHEGPGDFRCLQFANQPREVALLLRCDFSGLMGIRPADLS